MKNLLPLLALAAWVGLSPQVKAQKAASDQVAVYVSIPRPAGASDAVLDQEFAKAVPAYAKVPGLRRKYFTYDAGHFGGLYLFADRASATNQFSPAWHARVERTYGSKAEVTYFTVPVVTAGASRQAPSGGNVAVIVRVKPPWYATQGLIRRGFAKAIPDYAGIPRLIYKYFTIGDDRTFGGIYLWEDQASAAAYFGPAWHARVKQRYGHDGEVIMLKAPVSLIKPNVTGSQ
ncbi:hypothetical protein PbB2_00190 [Candidatus Phycosocius bacilliformis]|uniref:ABM domain-containing protein n=1 Tax=Candidatus Phycosocius bacilliformis TaxID=1445552 RepID=A0A2P2E646_9PROT|nr:YdhR family protein [Candidatus Phycosocius bacilliformis]GBF56534.1 hypothetical protein PbB2_00190 [Candidatus Phycosocius bacilliformis]